MELLLQNQRQCFTNHISINGDLQTVWVKISLLLHCYMYPTVL